MTFGRRLRLYIFGVLLGILFVYVFLVKDRDNSNLTDWLPNSRVLSKMSENELVMDSVMQCKLTCFDIHTADVNFLLENGDVNFKQSDQHRKPHPIYKVFAERDTKHFVLDIELQDTIQSRILDVQRLDREIDCSHCE